MLTDYLVVIEELMITLIEQTSILKFIFKFWKQLYTEKKMVEHFLDYFNQVDVYYPVYQNLTKEQDDNFGKFWF